MTCRLFLPLLFLPCLISATAVGDSQPRIEIDDVSVGIDGRYKLGRWAPLQFTLQTDEKPWRGDLQVLARDGDDAWARYLGGPLADVELEPGERREITTYVRVGRQRSNLQIVALSADRPSPEATSITALPAADLATQQRVLSVGSPIGLEDATRLIPRGPGEQLLTVHVEDVSALPHRWFGYAGVDVLVLTAADSNIYDRLRPTQIEAIVQWVSQGGRVMITVGSRGERVLTRENIFTRFTPGDFKRTLPLRDTSTIETLVEATGPLTESETGQRLPPPLYTQLENVRGEVLLSAGRDEPIVVRSAYGFGQVIFVGLDLGAPPITQWQDRDRLVAKLLGWTLEENAAAEGSQQGGEAVHLGFNDLAGQLSAALDLFDGVSMINFSTVAALIVAYVFIIGPIDFWFVSRVLRRRELTWITSSLVIIGFCGLTWWMAGRIRGDSPRKNQVDLVDIDVTTSTLRGTTWLHLYSPANRRFNVALSPSTNLVDDQDLNVLLSWQGLPGEALGGMNRESRMDQGGAEYLIAQSPAASGPVGAGIGNLTISTGSTKALTARWWASTKPIESYDLHYIKGGKLFGYLENPLEVRLTNCVIYHGPWVYRLGNLEPGQRVALSEEDDPLNAVWALTDRRFNESGEITQPWDQAMREDVPKIMRMMMFHEAATGRGHTDLLNRYYGFIDMSGLLQLDRAILVGTAEKPAAPAKSTASVAEAASTDTPPLEFTGDKQWTFYRIVFPTQPQPVQ